MKLVFDSHYLKFYYQAHTQNCFLTESSFCVIVSMISRHVFPYVCAYACDPFHENFSSASVHLQ